LIIASEVREAFVVVVEAAAVDDQAIGLAAPRVPAGQVLSAIPPIGHDGFPIIRLSSDYGVSVAVGCPAWIRS
jgi:hypothetical protein